MPASGAVVIRSQLFPFITALILVLAATIAPAQERQDQGLSAASAPQTVGTTPNEVPSDFELIYSYGPTHADWGGGVRVRLSSGGAYVVERQPRPSRPIPDQWTVKAKGSLPKDKLGKVYRALAENRFWELRNNYDNPSIQDGWVQSLRVRAGGRLLWVVMSNTNVPQVAAVISVLRRVMPKAHRLF